MNDTHVLWTTDTHREDGLLGIRASLTRLLESSFPQAPLPSSSIYQANDGLKPTWRISCDLASSDATSSSSNEIKTSFLPSHDGSDLRLYEHVSTRGPFTQSAPLIVSVVFRLSERDLEELDKWYEEEHVTMLSKVPGWIYTRRFRLIGGTSEEGQVECLAEHGYQINNGLAGVEFQAATSTEWRARVMGKIKWKERRVWRHCDSSN